MLAAASSLTCVSPSVRAVSVTYVDVCSFRPCCFLGREGELLRTMPCCVNPVVRSIGSEWDVFFYFILLLAHRIHVRFCGKYYMRFCRWKESILSPPSSLASSSVPVNSVQVVLLRRVNVLVAWRGKIDSSAVKVVEDACYVSGLLEVMPSFLFRCGKLVRYESQIYL